MGLFDDDDEFFKELEAQIQYPYCVEELNEGIVQEIFNKCLANGKSENTTLATLFPTALGYDDSVEKLIYFDSNTLLKNKKNIEYLFGQLHRVHNPNGSFNMSINDYNTTYQNKHWTDDKVALLKLLYLGVCSKTNCIHPFVAKTNTSVISPELKPTLSPEDPNFPAWWEEHKSEWEDIKKDGQEPGDGFDIRKGSSRVLNNEKELRKEAIITVIALGAMVNDFKNLSQEDRAVVVENWNRLNKDQQAEVMEDYSEIILEGAENLKNQEDKEFAKSYAEKLKRDSIKIKNSKNKGEFTEEQKRNNGQQYIEYIKKEQPLLYKEFLQSVKNENKTFNEDDVVEVFDTFEAFMYKKTTQLAEELDNEIKILNLGK